MRAMRAWWGLGLGFAAIGCGGAGAGDETVGGDEQKVTAASPDALKDSTAIERKARALVTFKEAPEYSAFKKRHAECSLTNEALLVGEAQGNRMGQWVYVVATVPGGSCHLSDSLTSIVKVEWESGQEEKASVVRTSIDTTVRNAVEAEELPGAVPTESSDARASAVDVFMRSEEVGAFNGQHPGCEPAFQSIQVAKDMGNRMGQQVFIVARVSDAACGVTDSIVGIAKWSFVTQQPLRVGVMKTDINQIVRNVAGL